MGLFPKNVTEQLMQRVLLTVTVIVLNFILTSHAWVTSHGQMGIQHVLNVSISQKYSPDVDLERFMHE